MDVKQTLRDIYRLTLEISDRQAELSDLRASSTATGGFDYSKERVQTSLAQEAPYTQDIERLTDLEMDIVNNLLRRDQLIDKVMPVMQARLTNSEYKVIFLRYFDGFSWSAIAERMSKSDSAIQSLYRRAWYKL